MTDFLDEIVLEKWAHECQEGKQLGALAHFHCQVLNTHPPCGAHVDTDETLPLAFHSQTK